jgi:hypothetical protein
MKFMLPRIASLEEEFGAALTSYVQEWSRNMGIMKEIRGHIIHEGSTNTIQRSATDSEQTKMVKAEVETQMQFSEIEAVDATYIIKKAIEIAKLFQEHHSRTLFQTLQETTTRTGQTVDARGAPLTNELIMEMLSKMPIDFEKSPHGDLSIVTSPRMIPRFKKLEVELNENPELRKKMDALMDRKRDEFREREINRNLAG